MAKKITIKQGEAKQVIFTLTDKTTGAVIPIPGTGTSFRFCVKSKETDTVYKIIKENADFSVVNAQGGKIAIIITAVQSTALTPGTYISELHAQLSTNNIDRSARIPLYVEKTLFHT